MTLLDLRHLTGQGVTKGSGLVFKPLANLAMRFGSGSAASSAGAAAAAVEEEANMEVLAEALKQKEEAAKDVVDEVPKASKKSKKGKSVAA